MKKVTVETQGVKYWQARGHKAGEVILHADDKGWWVYAWDGAEAHDMTDNAPLATEAEAMAFAREGAEMHAQAYGDEGVR